jgi:hypothetical protein
VTEDLQKRRQFYFENSAEVRTCSLGVELHGVAGRRQLVEGFRVQMRNGFAFASVAYALVHPLHHQLAGRDPPFDFLAGPGRGRLCRQLVKGRHRQTRTKCGFVAVDFGDRHIFCAVRSTISNSASIHGKNMPWGDVGLLHVERIVSASWCGHPYQLDALQRGGGGAMIIATDGAGTPPLRGTSSMMKRKNAVASKHYVQNRPQAVENFARCSIPNTVT